MINLKDCTDKCFALVFGQCTVLTKTDCDGCKFYKPKNCEDWVRVETEENTYLYTPDEYELRRKKWLNTQTAQTNR